MLDSIPADIACKLEYEYIAACAKHPTFPENGFSIIMEELGEAAQAYNDGDYEHSITELMHTATTCIRQAMELQCK